MMDFLSDYLLIISAGFITGMLLGAVSSACSIIRRSFKQVLNVADY